MCQQDHCPSGIWETGEPSAVLTLCVAPQGLGKTIQVIALLAYLAESRGVPGPFLVAAPASVLPNWEAEFRA